MKMETLKGKVISDFALQDKLVRIVDVVNFEGPLLTLYKNTANERLFLYDWIDQDENLNRWLIYRCKPIKLWEFINKKISHFDLFNMKNGVCYVLDIDKYLHIENVVKMDIEALPTIYFPEKEAYFEISDCIQYDKLVQFVNLALQKSESSKIYEPRKSEHNFWQKLFLTH